MFHKVNLPKLRHYNTFGSERLKMARESDFSWEDDLMTKWVIFYEVFVGDKGHSLLEKVESDKENKVRDSL